MKHPLAHRVNTTHPYTPAVATDIRKTFARVRRKQAEAQTCLPFNVQPLRRTGGAS